MKIIRTSEKGVSRRYAVTGDDARALYKIIRSKRTHKGGYAAIITEGKDRAGKYTEISLQSDTGPTTLKVDGQSRFISLKHVTSGETLKSTVVYPGKNVVVATRQVWDNKLGEFTGTTTHEISNPEKMVASISQVSELTIAELSKIEQRHSKEPENLAFNF